MSNKVDEQQILAVIANYFQQFTTAANDKIKIEMEDSKKYIYSFEEELRHRLSLY